MNKRLWSISVVCSLFALSGCRSHEPAQGSTVSTNDSSTATMVPSCDQLIDSLLRSSSYTNPIEGKDVLYRIDAVADSIIRVQVVHRNDENKEVTCGWLEVNVNTPCINDVSIDPDSPVAVQGFNRSLITQIRKTCKNLL